MGKSGFKVTINEKELGRLVEKAASDGIAKMIKRGVGVECPSCGRTFTATDKPTPCPFCGQPVALKAGSPRP